ncbi:MAG: DUF2235 domain-containing protein [Bacteroidales bacterium]|nr:DUF2235 domain-containing protein [Bacteroidales bacterium]
MAAIAEVGAKDWKKPANETGDVKIYFGVFFDGTNNHRLQVLIGKRYREKKGLDNKLSQDERILAKNFRLNDYEYIYDNNKNSYELAENVKIKKLQFERDALEKEIEKNPNSILTAYRKERLSTINEDLEFPLSKYKYDEAQYIGHAIQTNDFSNIALLEPFYQAQPTLNDHEFSYRIYVSGSGTEKKIEDVGNYKGAGFGQGSTGVVQKVIDAITCIENKIIHFKNVSDKNITLNIHLFGFSRGATEARVFAHVINQQKNNPLLSAEELTESEIQELTPLQRESYLQQKKELTEKHDYQQFKLDDRMKISNEMSRDDKTSHAGGGFALYSIAADVIAEKNIKKEMHRLNRAARNDIQYNKKLSRKKTEQNNDQHIENSLWEYVFKRKERIKQIIKNGTVNIPAMGIYDTVSSVGVLFKDAIGNKALIDVENCVDTWSKLHHRNVDDLGLNDLAMVKDVYHICALDEFRENFALVPVFESTASTKTEIYIPGCHADVGGGYIEGKDKEVKLYAGDIYYPITPKPNHLMSDEDRKSYNYLSLNNNQWPDEKMRLGLLEIGWINSSERGSYNYIPPISFKFDKSTKKGYSYIGLHLMRDYFNSLFKPFGDKFKIQDDLQWLKKEIESKQKKGEVNICVTIDRQKYKDLRSKYLHFSAEEYMNINIAKVNSPNFVIDSEGHKYYCRIEYTKDYCKKVEEEYEQYVKKRLEQIENCAN